MNPELFNGTTLAYIGDSYYEHKSEFIYYRQAKLKLILYIKWRQSSPVGLANLK